VRGEPEGSSVLFEVICISFICLWLLPFIGNLCAGLTLFYEMLDIRLDPLVMTGYIKHYGRAVGGNGRVGL
jgi:hypothetical protein